jgi:hypothetical protein
MHGALAHATRRMGVRKEALVHRGPGPWSEPSSSKILTSAPLVNGDIKIGDYRPLDPTQEPFGIKATLAFQWKINRFGIKQRLSRHNLVYGISSEWTKRTYLYTS